MGPRGPGGELSPSWRSTHSKPLHRAHGKYSIANAVQGAAKGIPGKPGAKGLRTAGRAKPERDPGPAGGLQSPARGRAQAGAMAADGTRPHGERHIPADAGVSCGDA